MLLALFSCTGKNKPAVTAGSSGLSKLIPALQGGWVNTVYMQSIRETRSPIRAFEKIGEFSAIYIPSGNLQGDSILAELSYNNHEGGEFTIFDRAGGQPHAFQTNLQDPEKPANHYELGYEATESDTTLFLFHCSNDNRVLHRFPFGKVVGAERVDNAGVALNYFVNQALFSGTYRLADGRDSTVVLTSDGALSGLEPYASYWASTDFVIRMSNNIDNLCFGLREADMECFPFEIKGDSLVVYESDIKEQDGEEVLEKGPVRLVLVKVL